MNTMIAHLVIPEKVYANENRFGRESYKYKREGQFMEDLQSHVWLEFFHRWFNFASYGEMYDDVIEYFSRKVRPHGKLDIHYENGKLPALVPVPHTRTMNPFIHIKSEDDFKKLRGEQEYTYKPFKFNGFKSFTEVYEQVQATKNNCYDLNNPVLVQKEN